MEIAKQFEKYLKTQSGRAFISVLLFFLSTQSVPSPPDGMYFATVADTEHFPWVTNLIESILKYNYTKVAKIAVFDLGLTKSEVDELNQMSFVEVHRIEDVNPYMRKKFVVRT